LDNLCEHLVLVTIFSQIPSQMKVLSNFIMKTDPVRELTTDIHTCQCILVENFFCIPEIGQWAFSTRLGGGSSTICDVFRCRRVSSHSAIICFQNSIPWPTTPPIIYQYHSVLWSGAGGTSHGRDIYVYSIRQSKISHFESDPPAINETSEVPSANMFKLVHKRQER